MDEVGESGVVIPLVCQACGQTFPATISDAMAAKLRAAGIGGDEIGDAIDRGLLSWRIVCPACARGQQN
jgi:hypothetical protein